MVDTLVVDENQDGEFDEEEVTSMEEGSLDDADVADSDTEFDTDQYVEDSIDGIMTDAQLSEGW